MLASITLNFNNLWHLFANNFEFHLSYTIHDKSFTVDHTKEVIEEW